jgi:hypothetical protein
MMSGFPAGLHVTAISHFACVGISQRCAANLGPGLQRCAEFFGGNGAVEGNAGAVRGEGGRRWMMMMNYVYVYDHDHHF